MISLKEMWLNFKVIYLCLLQGIFKAPASIPFCFALRFFCPGQKNTVHNCLPRPEHGPNCQRLQACALNEAIDSVVDPLNPCCAPATPV